MIDEREEYASEISSARSKLGEINEQIQDYMTEKKLESYEHGSYRLSFEEGEPELVIKKIKEPKPEPANK
jgi:hypothetical protein